MTNKILAIFLILILTFGGTFAITPNISGFSISPNIWDNTTDVNAIITSAIDMNEFCLSLTDVNTNSNCIIATSHGNFALNQFNLSLQVGSNTIYAFAKNEDGNYSTSLSANFILDNVGPGITITGINDGNDYNFGSFTNVTITADDEYSNPTHTIRYKFDSNDFAVYSAPFNVTLSEGTHTLSVDANDSLGNVSTKTITFKVDVTAPIINSITVNYNSGYTHTNDSTPTLTINATDTTPTTLYFSCKTNAGSNERYEVNYASTISSFDITKSDYECNNTNGDKTIYAFLVDKFGRVSAQKPFTVKFDNINPSNVTNLAAESRDGEIKLTWTAASSDNPSGNKTYKVYRNNTEFTTTTSTNATVTGLTNNQSYDFKVTTIDNAGNESSGATISATPSKYNANLSIKRGSENVNYVKNNDLVAVTCSFGETVNNARIRYRTYVGTTQSSVQTLGILRNGVSQINEEFTVNSNNFDRIIIWCEVDSTNIVSEKTIYVDDVPPTINWPSDFNTTFSGEKTITVNATDNRNISKVEFIFDGTTFTATKNGNNYSKVIITTAQQNGNKTLRAIATDEAGNTTEISRTVVVINELNSEQKATKAVNDSKLSRQIMNDFFKYLETHAITLDINLLEQKTLADNLLLEAESETDLNNRTQKANMAKEIYDALISNTDIESLHSQTAKLSEEEIESGLNNPVINQAMKEILKERAISSNLTREFNIIKIGETYVAQIIIKLNFDTNDDNFRVIEIIPKEFAKSAKQINSGFEFNIIEDDPIIEFIVPSGITQISYNISDIDYNNAMRLIEEEIITNFSAPPLILKEDEKTLDVITNQFNFVLIIIVIVLILLVIIIAGIFYIKNQDKGFGEKDFNPVKNITEKLNKPVEKNNKWGYKK